MFISNLVKRKYFRNTVIPVVVIIVIGLMLRGFFFIKHYNDFKLGGDARNYHLMSHQLVDDGIFGYWYEGMNLGPKKGESNARVTPGYPVFLSVVYYFFHDPYKQITIVRLIQVVIGGVFIPLLSFLIGMKLFKKKGIALLTCLFTAIYPTYVQSSILLLTEVTALFTMLLYFLLTYMALEKRNSLLCFLSGIAFAAHTLIRPAMLPLFVLPFVFHYLLSEKRDLFGTLKPMIFSAFGFILLMSPWWIRNIITLNSLTITGQGSGNPLLAGTYPYMKDLFYDVPENVRGVSHLQAELARKRIVEGFITQPFLYFKWYTIGKIQFMFSKPWLYNMTASTQLFHTAVHGLIVWTGFISMLFWWIRSKAARCVSVYFVLFLALCLIFIPEARYTYQLMFFLMLASACFFDKIIGMIKSVNTK